MKVLTLGAGFVADHLPYERILKPGERVDASRESIAYLLGRDRPDIIINCLGKTGRPNVDWCESHKSETYMSNVTLPLMIAEYCEYNNVHLINIGSGCIYFGDSPNKTYTDIDQGNPSLGIISEDSGWKETDFANPKSFYSKTKYACDLMLGAMPHVTTLRIRMPISTQDTERNLINKLRGYSKVIDIPNSVTFMSDLTRCIEWAANNRPGGIFHVANPQPLTAARIMREFQKYFPEHKFETINEQQLDQMTVAKRSNCILSTEKLQAAGFKMKDSEYALSECMARYVLNLRSPNV